MNDYKLLRKISKNGQMKKNEYVHIASYLGNVNFLVFGTGLDSDFWRSKNKNGHTIFLESDPKWIDPNKKDIFKIEYSTKRTEYKKLLEEYHKNIFVNLKINLPKEIHQTKWHVILVDGPPGYNDLCPGRMQSIYMAKTLSNEETNIFIHDCNRTVENLYASNFFSRHISEIGKKKLKHVKI